MEQLESHTDRTKALSFDEFYRTHRDPVFRALLVTLRNPEAAAEAVDEAPLRLPAGSL